MLGPDSSKVAFLAISIDPQHDTIESAHEYSSKWGMLNKWSFLVGSESDLQRVWDSFYINPIRDDGLPSSTLARTPITDVKALRKEIQTGYTIKHSAPVYLLDTKGQIRIVFTHPMDPNPIVHDIRLLLE